MTLLPLLLRFGPYLIAFLIGLGGGYKLEEGRYKALEAARLQDQLQYSHLREAAEKASHEALQREVDEHLKSEANNREILSQLTSERDSAVSSLDIAHRLLAAAQARPPAGSGAMPAAGHQSGTPDSTQGASDQSADALTRTTAAAVEECRDSIERLSALQQEVSAQLTR